MGIPSCPSGDAKFIEGLYYAMGSNSIDCSYYAGYRSTPDESACEASASTTTKEQFEELIDNGCQTLERNGECQVKLEKVDDVHILGKTGTTGLTPIAQCKSFGDVTTMQFCRNWWKKEKVFMCKDKPDFDFSALKKRAATVTTEKTLAGDHTRLSYTDVRKVDGQYRLRDELFLVAPKPERRDDPYKGRAPLNIIYCCHVFFLLAHERRSETPCCLLLQH